MTSYQHPTKISGYDVVCIGKGEMGYVYKATMPVLDPHVLPVTFAFKTIRPDDKMRAEILAFESRMAVDVRASQRLKHENVVRVDGIGEDDKLRLKYIMMEYVDGKNLKQLTDSSFPPAFETVKSIIVQLLSALQHVHGQHVIHRDIKPANVMLTRDGKVKLVDFGVALIDEPNDATRTKLEIVGTPDYMAPEQMKTGLVDGRADLYSTGVLLWELLTGKRAFQGHNRDHMPAPTRLNRAFHHPVDAVIFKALAKDPEKRFQSAKEFRVALERAGRVNYAQVSFGAVAALSAVGVATGAMGLKPETARNLIANVKNLLEGGPKEELPPRLPTVDECVAKVRPRFNDLNENSRSRSLSPEPEIANRDNKNGDNERMTIVTGPEGYTFYPMGISLARFATRHGIKLFAKRTSGTKENIDLMVSKENAGAGFVQGDIFLYYALDHNLTPTEKTELEAKLRRLFRLFSLYKEEVHVLVRRDFIGSQPFPDLSIFNGKTVLTDKLSTGSQITAKNLFKSGGDGTEVQAVLETDDGVKAICRVVAGDAKGMVVTAGAPTNLLRAIDALPSHVLDGLQFLPMRPISKTGYGVYEAGKITSVNYPWLKVDVDTLAVRSQFVAYAFNKDGTLGIKRCPQINLLKTVVRKHFKELQALPETDSAFHLKWKDVELLPDGLADLKGC